MSMCSGYLAMKICIQEYIVFLIVNKRLIFVDVSLKKISYSQDIVSVDVDFEIQKGFFVPFFWPTHYCKMYEITVSIIWQYSKRHQSA